jgi:hypothetical protein
MSNKNYDLWYVFNLFITGLIGFIFLSLILQTNPPLLLTSFLGAMLITQAINTIKF